MSHDKPHSHKKAEPHEPAPDAVVDLDPDQCAQELAVALHALPPAYHALGATSPPPTLPEPEALAAQLQPHMTPEVMQMGLFNGKFNPTKFIENVNAFLPLVLTLVGLFGGPKIPPITIPVPPPPVPPAT
jgi:hypothetical protein